VQQNVEQLAIENGPPVCTRSFSPWPFHSEEEIEAVSNVLRSGKVNYWNGTEGRTFEQEFARSVQCEHAIAIANGTLALELALYALGIGTGDEVVVTSRTFIASASCAVMRGALPVFADVDRDSQNVTAETIRAILTPRTKAIILVHLAGWPCEMDSILALAKQHGLKVIEDCAQASGATYKQRPVGSFGDMAAFSFCTDKIMTTGGEGGMLTTNSPELWAKAWSYKDHGKSWDAVYNRQHPGVFKWLHESFGTNWRLTEMQSAIGRIMLRKLPELVRCRRRNAALLAAGLGRNPALRIPVPSAEFDHSYYKFYAFLKPDALRPGWSRDRVVTALQAEGIPCGSGSCSEIYLERAFERPGHRPSQRLSIAQELGESSLMFVVHPTLGEAEMHDTCRAVDKVLRVATQPQAAARKAA
jgi:hypothetical protein